ncbi:MAG TPA: hypothetical protein VIU85_02255 [Chthoniobacterales bacterium]
MNREDDQQLWDLLGQTPPTEVSPFFARNVVRTVREGPQRSGWLRRWLSPGKIVPATGLAVAVIAAMLALHRSAPRPLNPADDTPDIVAAIDPQDYDVVADLDELISADESNLWDDDTQTL